MEVRGPDAVVSATDVVVATDPATAAGLTGQSAPPTHGVVTDWWAADEAPSTLPMLWVDGRPNPAGAGAEHRRHQRRRAHLCAAGTAFDERVGPAARDGASPPESVTRRHAADLLGAGGGWELLTRHVIRDALPAQPPPVRVRRPVRIRHGLWWCGDHRDTASIQGALISGRRTAEQLLRERLHTDPDR